jgi:hypothetical protein
LETQMMLKNERRNRLINAALSVVILFVPPLIVSTILWQWLG